MERRNPIGGRLPVLALLVHTCFLPAHAQTDLTCTSFAVPAIVRAEGVAEKMGDILLNCTGGVPGAAVATNLTVFLTVNVTNKLLANNFTDVELTVDTGSGPSPATVSVRPYAPSAVSFDGLSFVLPPSGKASLTISNLRGDASQSPTPQQPILAFLSSSQTTQLSVTSNQFAVAIVEQGLLAEFSSGGVTCTGSPLPANLTLAGLFADGTSFFSTRITEGFASAFQVKDAFSDTGTRVMVQYSGFPAGARLFVPDFVAGSSAILPTAGGDLGLPASGGEYAPSASGSLLLVLVAGADQNGAGGSLAFPVPTTGTTAFDFATEVTLTNGAGNAVYEVVDANPSVRESAQFPTFAGLTSYGGPPVVASTTVSFAPLSTTNVAAVAPIPRFADVVPPSDCSTLGDCNAAYFPHLEVDSPALNFSAPVSAFLQTAYVRVHNTGGGVLNWTATVAYQSGSGWLTADPASGFNDATVRIDAHPDAVPPGTYQATVTVNAGPLAGSSTIPVTFTVTPGPLPVPTITSIVNAANFQPGPLVPGSLATIFGTTFAGSDLTVTFDTLPANLLYAGPTQINLQVPAGLAGKSSSQVVVTVAGQASASVAASLAVVAPAIFTPG